MMTSKRKSHRNVSRKAINYSDSNSNYESDDDFEEEFEPRSKKSKTRVIGDKDVIEQQKNERKNPAQRLSVAEKLYQRDLETALQISLSNSPSEKEEQSHLVKKAKTKNVITIKEDSDYDPDQETVNEEKENDSDWSEREVRKKPVSKEKKAKNKHLLESDESDYDPEQETVSEEKENDSDWSENEMRRKPVSKETKADNKHLLIELTKKSGSTTDVGKISGIEETPQELPEAAAPPIKKTTTGKKTGDLEKNSTSMSRPTINRNLSSLGLGGVIIKNPGPPIRVGLSRNMKVKPLHSKVSISH